MPNRYDAHNYFKKFGANISVGVPGVNDWIVTQVRDRGRDRGSDKVMEKYRDRDKVMVKDRIRS